MPVTTPQADERAWQGGQGCLAENGGQSANFTGVQVEKPRQELFWLSLVETTEFRVRIVKERRLVKHVEGAYQAVDLLGTLGQLSRQLCEFDFCIKTPTIQSWLKRLIGQPARRQAVQLVPLEEILWSMHKQNIWPFKNSCICPSSAPAVSQTLPTATISARLAATL